MARTFYVGTDEVYVAPNWSISDKINSRSTLSITIVDKLSATITEGKTFKIYTGVTKIFEGIIVNVRKIEKYPNYIEYALSVADNSALADKRIISKVYENELAGDIVTDIITQVLGAENVTAGTIQNGPSIKKAVFNYISCAQALDYLKTSTGYVWNIDKDKKLHFFERSTNLAPWTLDSSVQHSKFTQDTVMEDYRNTQYVRGGRGKTATQTNEVPTPAPDGQSRNFVVRFPIAERPTIEINLNGAGWVAVNSSDVGVNGLNSGKKWYWSYNSNILSQDESETVLGTVDALRITYVGLRNLFTKVEDTVEITKRIAIEGNSGIYEKLAVEKSLNESEQALQFASGLIDTFAEDKDKISFSTEVSGLESGQLLTVSKPLYGISDTFLIESINIKPKDSETLEYSVKAIDGVSVGGWEEYFKNIIKNTKDLAIAENELLILINKQAETENISSDTDITVYDMIYCSETTICSESLIISPKASEVTVSD
jgi:hypothetical protein